MVMTAYVTLKD